jgi:hypothetical protein
MLPNPSDFIKVFDSVQQPPPPTPYVDPFAPDSPTPTPKPTPASTSTHSGCSYGGDLCISPEGGSFSLTCNGIGLEVYTTGRISIVTESNKGQLTLTILSDK